MGQAHVNEGYELYQIITDFGDPLEIFREGIQNSFDADATKIYVRVYEESHLGGNKLIIEMIDNGHGIRKDQAYAFFDIAHSTKVNSSFLPTGNKHGYKGHGSKVFFNAEQVTICSKTADGEYWTSCLKEPLKQIGDNGTLFYTDPCDNPSEHNICLPQEWESGFMVRIVSPRYFLTQHTHAKLNHKVLRDYIKWYTIFGTVETCYSDELKNKDIKLYLSGLNLSTFSNTYKTNDVCDPIPDIVDDTTFNSRFEAIPFGHYFPAKRTTETELRKYAANIKNNPKAWFDYYSRIVYNNEVVESGVKFRLIISIEGYEAKRRYDLLLSRRGVPNEEGTHTDASRYGLWACKGGVPVEKIDDWIEGGRGVGTYTYMQAFVDCDDFQLTANRGSIRNTDIEKLDLIKKGINRVFNDAKVSAAIRERAKIEELEKAISSIEVDEKALKARYKSAKSRKVITLPNGRKLLEPSKNGKNYNESETFALLIGIMDYYPDLFGFQIIDYNTTKGIDFVVDCNGSPKYIELKGTLTKKINHPFRCLYKFICYDIDVRRDEIVEDVEYKTQLVIRDDVFKSPDYQFNGKTYTSYELHPTTAYIQSMEIIKLKSFLVEVLGATIE